MATELLLLQEATERLRPSRRRHLGVRTIEVKKIIGTDSRGGDFDRHFHALRPELRERRRRVAEAFPDAFPPIVVEQLGDAYFVIDGHHRVALARERGMALIDAEVTELTARWRLGADADRGELVHAEQERLFMTESGLADVRPEPRIRFTRPVGYRQLFETIQIHGYRLMVETDRPLERSEIAYDWYSRVYLPVVEVVHDQDLEGACPCATVSDKFLWLTELERELSVEYGAQRVRDVVHLSRQGVTRRRGLRARWRGRG